jgi:small subunit ribosomal protein S1
MGLHRVDDAGAAYTGRHMTFLITRFEENGRNIVVSARALLEQEREQQKEALQASLQEGATVQGTISSIRDFGAFVDIGGVDGMIPISEIGWSRVEDIKEHLAIGQEVTAVIKKLDWKAGRITLSLKETMPNPWDAVRESFTEGSIHTGTVARLTTFGAFVTLAPGIDGLIHISKLGGGRRINHPREALETGQEVEVKVEGVDNETRKISLAPTDYVSSESKEAEEKNEYNKFLSEKPVKKQEDAVGSLGALLQAKLTAKNAR